MKTKTIFAPVAAAILLAGTAAGSVFAAEAMRAGPAPAKSEQSGTPVAAAAKKDSSKLEKDFLKLSDDGGSAMEALHAARIAIYNGDIKAATDLVAKAQTFSTSAKADATKLDKVAETSMKVDATKDYVPLASQIMVQDAYSVKPEDAGHLTKANAALKKGDHKQAAEEAVLVDQTVSYAFAAVPYDTLSSSLDTASTALKNNDAQAANMALKKAEDAVVFDTVSMDMGPATASQS